MNYHPYSIERDEGSAGKKEMGSRCLALSRTLIIERVEPCMERFRPDMPNTKVKVPIGRKSSLLRTLSISLGSAVAHFTRLYRRNMTRYTILLCVDKELYSLSINEGESITM